MRNHSKRTAWTWNPGNLKAARVVIFQKQPGAHTEFSIWRDIFKFHETDWGGGGLTLHVYCPWRGGGLGYGDLVWRVRVNRGKGESCITCQIHPTCKSAPRRNKPTILLIKGFKIESRWYWLHYVTEDEEWAWGLLWKWEGWNILQWICNLQVVQKIICKPSGGKDYQMKPSYKMRP